MNEKLSVYYEDIKVGELTKDEELLLSFKYSNNWLEHPSSFQLSLALPLQKEPFGNKLTLSFFENLLPEGDVRRILGVSNGLAGTFDFLKEYGADCAGAIVLTKTKLKTRTSTKASKEVSFEVLDEAIENKQSVAELISEESPGYLSIAGAQDKFPAIVNKEKIFIPQSNQPTTHIIKTPIFRSGVKESVFNEYYCMQLAKKVGLNVPDCFILNTGHHYLYVTARYDRVVKSKKKVQRLHQQDFCQAQGVVSDKKYEATGGPSLKDNYDLIINHVGIKTRRDATFMFLDWICFNLLIGNNDCHSKNLSFLLVNNKIELAPFYDLICTAIYPKLSKKFAFKIGGRADYSKIGINQFYQVEKDLGIKEGTLIERMLLMSAKVIEHKDNLVEDIKIHYKDTKIPARISELIEKRCKGFKKQGIG